jgi:diguanylate cyclase
MVMSASLVDSGMSLYDLYNWQPRALRNPDHYDALTDLPNRIFFHHYLEQALAVSQHNNKPLALICVDLDRFRDINNSLGLSWGDALLRQIGPRLQSLLCKSDVVARVNGDEFAILLSSIAGIEEATRIVSRILDAFQQPFTVEEYPLEVSVSVGVALCPDHGTNSETLIRRAALAMYTAKRSSTGYAFYTADHDPYSSERFPVMSELRQAIVQNQLVLHYQPKASLSTGQVQQVEALVRWRHPQHGLLPPSRFIPLAEQTGLMKPLSFWVLETALRQRRAWQQAGLDLAVSVNLTMLNLQDSQFPDKIAELLQTWCVPPGQLEVEVTESVLAVDPQQVEENLSRLCRMGVRVAIDDFGTGYSSFASLRCLPVNTIKIDKSFVIGMTTDPHDEIIVRTTIDLGHNLGLTVVAEGVEDREAWDRLSTLGCDLAQGYYLSRPMPAPKLTRWLKGRMKPRMIKVPSRLRVLPWP